MSRFERPSIEREQPAPVPQEPRSLARLEREQRRSFLKGVGFVESYHRGDTREVKSIPLTARDAAVMSFLKDNTAAPVDVLASRFFAVNPQSGKVNANPVRAATRRLDELARAGYLVAASIPPSPSREPGGRVYLLGRAGAAALGVPLRGVTPKRMHHHLQTLRHVEVIRKELEGQGRRIAALELERGEMSSRERNAGRHVPDAIITVDDGSTIAVEYVSTNYTDEMIREKGAYFNERYGEVRWSANSIATRARVLRVAREPCDIIR